MTLAREKLVARTNGFNDLPRTSRITVSLPEVLVLVVGLATSAWMYRTAVQESIEMGLAAPQRIEGAFKVAWFTPLGLGVVVPWLMLIAYWEENRAMLSAYCQWLGLTLMGYLVLVHLCLFYDDSSAHDSELLEWLIVATCVGTTSLGILGLYRQYRQRRLSSWRHTFGYALSLLAGSSWICISLDILKSRLL